MSFTRVALHLGGLWALAFAQPLFELLGRNAEFFVARGSTTGDILLLAFGYTLVPPLAGALLVWVLGRIRPAVGTGAMLVLVALLVAALALPPVGDLLGGSAVAVPVALAVGAGAAVLYSRAAVLRSLLTVLGVAPLLVLLLFLVVSPVRGLLFPGAGDAVAGPARSTVPIVHVVFDELPLATLLGTDGRIDGARFPNFARLARESTWYRNATTVDDLTAAAVPAQLTGDRTRDDQLPTARDHPRNLFTLFERSHAETVVEPITALCPTRVCGDVRPGTGDRLRSLESDLEVVVQHLLLPDDLREGLPAVDRVWEGFETPGSGSGVFERGANLRRDVLARLAQSDATAGFERAIAALNAGGSRPPLLFVHSTLPHGPWRYLPDGRRYDIEGKEYPGLAPEGWTGPQWQVDQGFQRHVLQVQYADRLLGRLLDALHGAGLFDRAVIVVAADHGAAFTTGEPRRPVDDANIGSIAPVPFFVKRPRQDSGGVDDRAVRTIDVLPTIAAAAGVRLPWKADGMPAGSRPVDPDASIDVAHQGVPVVKEPLGSVLAKRDARGEVEAGLLADGLYAMGPRPDLIGRRVDVRGGRRVVAPDVFVSGRVDVEPDTELAVAVNGRVEATTRAYRDGGRTVYAALVPPASLHDGPNTVAVLEVLADGELRPA